MKRIISIILLVIMIIPMNGSISVTAAASLSTPNITRGVEGHNTNTLYWSTVKGAVKYRVFIKSNGSWKKLGDTTKTSYVHKVDGRNTTTNTYTVRCISKTGKYVSNYNKKGFTFTHHGSPKVSYKVKRPNNNSCYLVLNWNQYYKKPTNSTKYAIYAKNNICGYSIPTWKKIATVSGNTTSYSISSQKLKQYQYYESGTYHASWNSLYSLTVRAVDNKGNPLSDFSELIIYHGEL